MDPDKVRAYLQVACAGLGFDIGEVWWTSNENGSSTVAAIEEKNENGLALSGGPRVSCKPRFVQLYTSKSFAEKRSMLVGPDDDDGNDSNGVDSRESLSKHVLSPLLVDAISKTAQVVWANTKKQEGLLGRSDIRLQTAVGMPVAVDNSGNMCIVVMFSPNNIQSTDDAVEYLQSISQSATSSSIPTLKPVFDPKSGMLAALPHHTRSNQVIPLLASSLNDGVETRFVSLEVDPHNAVLQPGGTPEIHTQHELAAAPKDCFGIPMLPSFAELGGTGVQEERGAGVGGPVSDAFDEASYGVWSTIMETIEHIDVGPLFESRSHDESSSVVVANHDVQPMNLQADIFSASATPRTHKKVTMSRQRKERLEEFASAFLGVSVFDLADVWIPLDGHLDYLSHVMSVSSSSTSESLNAFMNVSENILVKYWSGAVGRAFSSGNPVWSANPDVFVDSGRADLFAKVHFQTALAVPIFSGKSASPACVLCCYSYVRTGSVPFVLRFVQQALRLLWDGLDKVEPHESVGRELWRDVAPADLGEMAADVEMQQHFLIKKRPRSAISAAPAEEVRHDLVHQLNALDVPSGVPSTRSIYTGQEHPSPPLGSSAEPEYDPSVDPLQIQTFETIQSHLNDAVKSVAEIMPYPVHKHVATNVEGSKRAHVLGTSEVTPGITPVRTHPQPPVQISVVAPLQEPGPGFPQQSHLPQQRTQPLHQQPAQSYNLESNLLGEPHTPLPMPRPLPLPNALVMRPPVGSQQQNNPSLHEPGSVLQVSNQGQQYVAQHPHADQTDHEEIQVPSQAGHSIHFDHKFASNVQTAVPATVAQTPIAATPIAPVPTNRISATGISFAQPQSVQSNPINSVPLPGGSIPTSTHVVMTASIPYCLTTGNSLVPSVPTSGKPCRIQGCTEPSVVRRPYCVRHSGNRLCEHAGCSKCAQGSTRFCIAHGGGRRCTFPGCDKGARDKFFCAAHGGGKRCKFDGCNKSAVGGSHLCTAHGGGRRCSVDGCDKSAQSSTKFCVKHGGGKKCFHPGCEKVARGRTQYCASHGGGVRCKLEGCNRVAIGKLQLCRAHGGGARPRSKQQDGGKPPNFAQPADSPIGMVDIASV